MLDSISITWNVDDVRMAYTRPITDDECREVLARADKYHDCNIGINLDVLECYAREIVNEADDDDPGSLDDRYQIYLACIEGTGQPVKAYDEWLQS